MVMPDIYAVGLSHDERTTKFREYDSFREQTANEQAQLAGDPCSQCTLGMIYERAAPTWEPPREFGLVGHLRVAHF